MGARLRDAPARLGAMGGGGFLTVGLVRAARRRADVSQRGLAARAGVHHATIAKIEAGQREPSLGLFVQIMRAAGLRLIVVDADERQVEPMEDVPEVRDLAGRRFPAHLDLILEPRRGEWWGDKYGLARPPETFHRDRAVRDEQRRRSRWEVRVKQFRSAPPPRSLKEFYAYFVT
jgi:DNA-binding XRE family transcriptional regulator